MIVYSEAGVSGKNQTTLAVNQLENGPTKIGISRSEYFF